MQIETTPDGLELTDGLLVICCNNDSNGKPACIVIQDDLLLGLKPANLGKFIIMLQALEKKLKHPFDRKPLK